MLKRLEQYEKITRPVIDYYKELNILNDFEGRTSDEIWPKVLDCLTTYIPLEITKSNSINSK